jgi:hypothetical protein
VQTPKRKELNRNASRHRSARIGEFVVTLMVTN